VYGQMNFEPSLEDAKRAGRDLAMDLVKSLENQER